MPVGSITEPVKEELEGELPNMVYLETHTHTHARLTALFRDCAGEPVPER